MNGYSFCFQYGNASLEKKRELAFLIFKYLYYQHSLAKYCFFHLNFYKSECQIQKKQQNYTSLPLRLCFLSPSHRMVDNKHVTSTSKHLWVIYWFLASICKCVNTPKIPLSISLIGVFLPKIHPLFYKLISYISHYLVTKAQRMPLHPLSLAKFSYRQDQRITHHTTWQVTLQR